MTSVVSIFILIHIIAVTVAFADPARLLPSHDHALQARADIIAQAMDNITVEYFTVGSDKVAVGGLALLRKAARRGVKVRILVDGLSHRISNALLSALKTEPNFEIKVYNPFDLLRPNKWMNRLHDKALCVDGKVCIVGGRNISNKYFLKKIKGTRYNDLDVIFGGPAVKVAQDYFEKLWVSPYSVFPNLGKYDPEEIAYPCHPSEADICEREKEAIVRDVAKAKKYLDEKLEQFFGENGLAEPRDDYDWLDGFELNSEITFLHDPPDQPKSSEGISAQLYKVIRENTKHALLIISPYVVLSQSAYALLKELRDNDVYIRVVTNSVNASDNMIAQVAYKKSRQQLLDLGVELWEYKGPDTLHAKAAVMDYQTVMVGSYNFDLISDQKNLEISIVAKNREISEELISIINSFQQNAYLIGPEGTPIVNNDNNFDVIPVWKRISMGFLKVLNPMIEGMMKN